MNPQPLQLPRVEPAKPARARVGLRRILWTGAAALLVGWVILLTLGHRVAERVAVRWPAAVLGSGGSKTPDIIEYVYYRFQDLLWIGSVSWITLLAAVLLWRWIQRHTRPLTSFVWGTLLFFVLANLWWVASGKAALFWLILRGPKPENQAQFRAKECFLREISRPVAALVGSSQARTQFVEEDFNAQMGQTVWMMELHFPGCRADDVYFLSERWGCDQVAHFVYYVSPISLYSANDTAIGKDLQSLRNLPEMWRLGTWSHFASDTARYVALGMLIPLFQGRAVIQHALFGFNDISKVPLPKPATTPVTENRRDAGTIRLSERSDYQKQAFLRFLERTAEKGQRVILIGGQINPLHEAGIDPAVREDYRAFLASCAQHFPHVTLVWQDELMPQPPEVYEDATHIKEEAARRFTQRFVEWAQEQRVFAPALP